MKDRYRYSVTLKHSESFIVARTYNIWGHLIHVKLCNWKCFVVHIYGSRFRMHWADTSELSIVVFYGPTSEYIFMFLFWKHPHNLFKSRPQMFWNIILVQFFMPDVLKWLPPTLAKGLHVFQIRSYFSKERAGTLAQNTKGNIDLDGHGSFPIFFYWFCLIFFL